MSNEQGINVRALYRDLVRNAMDYCDKSESKGEDGLLRHNVSPPNDNSGILEMSYTINGDFSQIYLRGDQVRRVPEPETPEGSLFWTCVLNVADAPDSFKTLLEKLNELSVEA